MRSLMRGAIVAMALSGLQGCASVGAGHVLISLGTSIFGGIANGAVLGGSAARVILGPDARDEAAGIEVDIQSAANVATVDNDQEVGPQLSAHLDTLLSTPLRSRVPDQIANLR